MSKIEIYLHIGEHKTASTYIQKLSSIKYDYLKNNLDLLYPKTGRGSYGGHHHFSWFLLGKSGEYGKNFNIQKLLTEIGRQQCQKVLISSEDFEFLKEYFTNKYSIVPILYLRNQVHGAFSKWQELVKKGKINYPFSEFFCGPLQRAIKRQRQIVELWSYFFGDRLKIIIYDNLKQTNEDPYLFLLRKCLQLPASDRVINLSTEQNIHMSLNSSILLENLELIRELNIKYGSGKNFRSQKEKINTNDFYKNLLSKGRKFKSTYHFNEIAINGNDQSIIELNNSICNYIINNFYHLIVNPYTNKKIFINQDSAPFFELLPDRFYKKYLDLEDNRFKIKKWKQELRS